MMHSPQASPPRPPDEDFLRLPGLFRRWELEQVIEIGQEFVIEEAAPLSDGTELFAVYQRPASTPVRLREAHPSRPASTGRERHV